MSACRRETRIGGKAGAFRPFQACVSRRQPEKWKGCVAVSELKECSRVVRALFCLRKREADDDGYHFPFSVYLLVEFCPFLLFDRAAAGGSGGGGVDKVGGLGASCDPKCSRPNSTRPLFNSIPS